MLEVTVSLLLLAMILTFVYESFFLAIQTKDRVEKGSEKYQAARVAIERMAREIQSAYIEKPRNSAGFPIPNQPAPNPLFAPTGGGGTTNSPTAPRTIFLGVNGDSEGFPRDRLDFTTHAHDIVAALGPDDKQSDHEEVGYYAETDYKANRTDLMHREDFTMDDDPAGGGDVFPLIENIRGINFRYLDPQTKNWEDSWDSREKGALPAAVEISLWIVNSDHPKNDFYFSKIVRIPLYTPTGLGELAGPQGGNQNSNGNPFQGNGQNGGGPTHWCTPAPGVKVPC